MAMIIDIPARRRRITVGLPQRVSFGRNERARVTIPEDSFLSGVHFVLAWDGGACKLENLGRNGTLVNGAAIAAEVELHAGDNLKVGPLDFEVVVVYSEKGKKRPPVKDVADMAQRTATTKPPVASEEDISSWLGEPEMRQPSASRWVVESSPAEPSSTSDTVQMSNSSDTAPALPPVNSKDKPAPKDKPKFAAPEAPKAVNSQQAAMDTLKRLMNKR